MIWSCNYSLKSVDEPSNQNVILLHEGKGYTNFKNEVFIRCLKKLYPVNLSVMLDTLDASTSANLDQLGYNFQLEKIADSLAEAFKNRNDAEWSIENKKVTMNVCLNYRNSAELDEFTLNLFRKQNKIITD